MKGTQVLFQEVGDKDIVWQAEAEIEAEYFQQVDIFFTMTLTEF